MTEIIDQGYRTARKIVVAVVGGTVVLIGALMIFLPGPAFVVIPAGLGILAIEFAWARRWLRRMKESGEQAWESIRGPSRHAKP